MFTSTQIDANLVELHVNRLVVVALAFENLEIVFPKQAGCRGLSSFLGSALLNVLSERGSFSSCHRFNPREIAAHAACAL